MPPPRVWADPWWLFSRLASGVGVGLHTRSAPLRAVAGRFDRGRIRCPACGRAPVICGGGVVSPCPHGGVTALEVCLAGRREGFPRGFQCRLCMVASWLLVAAWGSRRCVGWGVAPAGRHEGVERLIIAGVSAGRRPLVGCALGCVGGCCPGVGLGPGLRLVLGKCLPGRCVPWRARAAAVCSSCGWSGACMTRGPRLMGRRWGRVGCMPGARRLSPRYRVGQCPVPCCFHLPPCLAADWLACWCAGHPAGPSFRQVTPLWVVHGRLGPPLAPAATFCCRRPSPSSVAPAPLSTVGSSLCGWVGAAGGAAASSFVGLAAWVWPSGTDAGLGWLPMWRASVRVLPLPSAAVGRATGVLPSGCPQNAGPPSGARGLASSPLGRRSLWWRAPGPGPGPGWGPGDYQAALPLAVLPVRLVVLGFDGAPVRPAPRLVDGTLGSTCRAPLEPGDWGSMWGRGRGGSWCLGVARARRWWRRSG